jgi:hypothetical protein
MSHRNEIPAKHAKQNRRAALKPRADPGGPTLILNR